MFLANVLQVSDLRESSINLGAVKQVLPVGVKALRGFTVGLWVGNVFLFCFITSNLPPIRPLMIFVCFLFAVIQTFF